SALRKEGEAVAEVEKEQEALKRKIQEAGKSGDRKKREEELKPRARRQRELQKKTQETLKQLSRLRSERARQALGQAAEEMEDAGRQLGRGERDNEKQEDVLDRLDEARREGGRARRQGGGEWGREELARGADGLAPV